MSKSINIRFPDELESEINRLRGDVSFSAWVKRAVIQRIERETGTPDTSALETVQGRPMPASKQPKPVSKPKAKQGKANAARSEAIKEAINSGISSLSSDDKTRIISARYPKNEFFKAINESISKDSIAKYWGDIESKLKA